MDRKLSPRGNEILKRRYEYITPFHPPKVYTYRNAVNNMVTSPSYSSEYLTNINKKSLQLIRLKNQQKIAQREREVNIGRMKVRDDYEKSRSINQQRMLPVDSKFYEVTQYSDRMIREDRIRALKLKRLEYDYKNKIIPGKLNAYKERIYNANNMIEYPNNRREQSTRSRFRPVTRTSHNENRIYNIISQGNKRHNQGDSIYLSFSFRTTSQQSEIFFLFTDKKVIILLHRNFIFIYLNNYNVLYDTYNSSL